MLVIHGIWARGALCLWAEDARLPARTPEPLAGRRSRAPRPHPFAADPETIAGALASLGAAAAEAARQAPADELTVWLPSAPDGPQAAPELIGAPGFAQRKEIFTGRELKRFGPSINPASTVHALTLEEIIHGTRSL